MRCRLVGILSLVVAGLACSPKNDRPDNANLACDSGNCVKPGPGGGGGGSAGDAGVGSDVEIDALGGVSVTGSIVELTGDDFYNAIPFTGQATVGFEGAAGLPVEGAYSGSSFIVHGAAAGPGVWATVTPKPTGILPTIQPADTSAASLELVVVPATTIDTIYAFLSVPEQREIGAAHVVVRFLNAKTGVPIMGVTVSHGADIVSYDTGGSWSDTAPGSGAGGYAVIVNVSTAKTPNQQTFKFNAPTASAGISLLVQPDSVTLADVLVD